MYTKSMHHSPLKGNGLMFGTQKVYIMYKLKFVYIMYTMEFQIHSPKCINWIYKKYTIQYTLMLKSTYIL